MRWIMLMMILLLTFEVRVKEYPFLPDSLFAFERYLTVIIEEERDKFLENGDEKSLLGEVITDLRNDVGYSAQKLNPGVSKWGGQEKVYFINLNISKTKTDSSGSLLYVAHMSHRSKEVTFRLTGDSRKRGGGEIIEGHKTDFVCSGESITQSKAVVALCQFPDDFLSLVLEKVRADLLSFTQKKSERKDPGSVIGAIWLLGYFVSEWENEKACMTNEETCKNYIVHGEALSKRRLSDKRREEVRLLYNLVRTNKEILYAPVAWTMSQ